MLGPPQGYTPSAILPGTVELSDIVDIADQRLLGNVSGGAAAPSALTRTQALALLSGGAAASDTAPVDGLLAAQHAYAQATVNTTGAALRLAGGIGRRLVTVVNYTLIDAGVDTITVTANGTATVGTEGTAWTAATSNAATATSIASWINGLANVSAVAVGSSVYVTPDSTCYSLTLATSMAAGEGTVTNGTNGNVLLPDGSATVPSISFFSGATSGLFLSSGVVGVSSAGVHTYLFGSSSLFFLSDSGLLVFGAGSDLSVGRLGAASMKQGRAPSATPIAQTFTLGEASRPGTDTNIGGASGTLRPGLGTGTGTASGLTLQGVVLAASGTDTQTYQDMVKITGVSLGFYNHAVTALQTGVAVTAEGIHAALVNLGLITA